MSTPREVVASALSLPSHSLTHDEYLYLADAAIATYRIILRNNTKAFADLIDEYGSARVQLDAAMSTDIARERNKYVAQLFQEIMDEFNMRIGRGLASSSAPTSDNATQATREKPRHDRP